MKRFPIYGVLLVMAAASMSASAQHVVASRDPAAGEKTDVLKPGSGSFASYLSQSSGAAPSGPAAAAPAPSAAAAAAMPAATPAAPTAAAAPSFVLKKGEMVHAGLQAWAAAAGWELIWYPDKSWKVIGDTTIAAGDVTQAVSEVVTILRDERRAVRLEIADGNRIMEVLSTDVVSNQEAFRE